MISHDADEDRVTPPPKKKEAHVVFSFFFLRLTILTAVVADVVER